MRAEAWNTSCSVANRMSNRNLIIAASLSFITAVGITVRADEESPCTKAQAVVEQMERTLKDTSEAGQIAEPLALAFLATQQISTSDSDTLFQKTQTVSDGLTKLVEELTTLDGLVPAQDNQFNRLTHTALANYVSPLKTYNIKLFTAVMSTVSCAMDETFAVCQANGTAPAYTMLSLQVNDGHTTKYQALNLADHTRAAGLREIVETRICGGAH